MTAESTTWNVERVWSATTEDKTEQFSTLELSRFRGLVMLGTAGSGKTTEAARLANQERASGASVHECRLAEFADTSGELADRLSQISNAANERTVFYLDALDEAMIPVHAGGGSRSSAGSRTTCKAPVRRSESHVDRPSGLAS